MSKYSVMIPVYNKINCLKSFFHTVLEQDYKNYEIIVVDDCSCDGSYEYLLNLKNKYKNLKVFKNEMNLGIGETRNILISKASGEYLLFVDPDDYIETSLLTEIDKYSNLDLDIIRFQNIIEPIGENQLLLEQGKDPYRYSCNNTDIISGEQALILWFFGEKKINTFPWTYAIKRELFNDVKYPKISVLEDFAITPYLIAKSNKIKAIDYVGYHYLKYDNSLSTNSRENAIDKLKIFKEVIKLSRHYIDKTSISSKTKNLYYKDINNRYNIRKEKIDSNR